MSQTRSIRVRLGCAVIVCVFSLLGAPLGAVPPTAPGNLTATVNGQVVTLTWSASGNSPTQYIIQVGFAPGQTALTVPVSAAVTTFTASGGPGTYFVRVVAANADGLSGASNEVTVVIASSCSPPGAPQNLRAMIRGAELFLVWRRPASGAVSGYSVQAGTAPGQTIAQFQTGGNTMNTTVGSGTFVVRTIATSPCGNSAASNEITVSFPSNSVREADPAPGTLLEIPDIRELLVRLNNQNPPTHANSCPTGREYEPNPWQNFMVDQLRTYSTRFGYNAKPTRTPAQNNGFPVIAAGDEIAYFIGAGNAEGSSQAIVIDILQGHCGGSPVLTYRDIAPEPVIWTGAGRFTGDQR